MEFIYKQVNRLANGQRRLIDHIASEREYSGAQGKVIHYLFNNQDRSIYQKEIESVFGMRASTATELLKSLDKQGLIKRVPSKEDARYKEIILTEKAEQYKENVFHDVERLEGSLMRNLSEEEVKTWLAITQKMIEGLGDE